MSGQIFARAKTCTVPPCVYIRPEELDEVLKAKCASWDLTIAGQLFDWHGSIFVRTRLNTRTVQLFAATGLNFARIRVNTTAICTDPCEQAVKEQNFSVQKFVRARVS